MSAWHFEKGEAFARQLDEKDPLRGFREKFWIPKSADGSPCLYLVGNSLGLQPRNTRAFVEQELQDWADFGIAAHFSAKTPWYPYHEFLSAPLGRVVGAEPSEVVAMNSLTVNLHLMLHSFYRPTSSRFRVVIEKGCFPSDRYAVVSQIAGHGRREQDALWEWAPCAGEATLRTEDLLAFLDREGHSVALVLLEDVNYLTGQAFPVAEIAAAAHRQGCLVGLDLAHGAGNLELRLHDWQVDFAAWCSYKYLNAGPGAVAGCFVHARHAGSQLPRLAGWWGHDKVKRFQMSPDFSGMAGAEGWQVSNPPILQLAALRASLEIFDEAGMPALRRKSEALTAYLEYLLNPLPRAYERWLTPSEPAARGCHLSLQSRSAKAIVDKLKTRGVMCDFREPDGIRLAAVPLYNGFHDVYRVAEYLREYGA